ncbi:MULTISPECIES: hypothetical protein [unclassified Streptomyces]|uniref:hypothetical protein n=1 Tax=unclassified Streptomyces TaxID=2593676 RepID=UPI0035D6A964
MSDKRRALEHRSAAVAVADLYGVEWRTPWALTQGWTVYRELSEGARFGRLDERRMIVSGPARNVARLWEQAAAVAAEVWAARPVDPWDAPEDEATAVLTAAGRYTELSVIEPAPVPVGDHEREDQGAESEALAAQDDEHQEHDGLTGETRAELTGVEHTPQVTGPPRSSRSPYRPGGIPFGIRRGCPYGSISTRARPRRRPAPAAPPSRPRHHTTRGTGHRARAVSYEKGTCA